MRWLRWWWRQQDRFEWFTTYLGERRLQRSARVSIAVITSAFAAVAVAMLGSPAGPHAPWPRFVEGTAAITGVALAVLWLWRSTLGQSRLYGVAAAASIAAACLAQSDPQVGITGSFAFVILAGYLALMHGAKASAANVLTAITVAAVLLARVSDQGGDVVLAACQAGILALFGIGTPIMLNAMLHVMASDITRSDVDALTGLLNRRGFYRHTARLIDRCADTCDGHLVIAMIDISNDSMTNTVTTRVTKRSSPWGESSQKTPVTPRSWRAPAVRNS